MAQPIADMMSPEETKMPVLFIGHGSPMNAVEDNPFTRGWKKMVEGIPTPKAILCISAHWETQGTRVLSSQNPKMIYDMYGFPQKLYDLKYPAPGAPKLAESVANRIKEPTVLLDDGWGFDHGTWSVLAHTFPDATIPCFQLSLNKTRNLQWHYDLAQQLGFLRQRGVLIVGSGNIVHNLRYMRQMFQPSPDWALEFDEKSTQLILDRNHKQLINYLELGSAAEISINSGEHYLPMLYTLALQEKDEDLVFTNHGQHDTLIGTGMRCIKIG